MVSTSTEDSQSLDTNGTHHVCRFCSKTDLEGILFIDVMLAKPKTPHMSSGDHD